MKRSERTEERDPWERQYGESQQAFQAFAEYRDMGVGRTGLRVAQKLQKSAGLMNRWSGRWGWVDRARAWDDEKDRQARASQIVATKVMNERQALLGAAMLGKVVDRLTSMTPDEVSKLTPNEMSRLVEVAGKLERVARGAESDRIGHVVSEEPADDFELPADPRTRELVHELLDQMAAASAAGDTGGLRMAGESGEVEAATPSVAPEPDDDAARVAGDHAADRDGTAEARQEPADQ